MNQDETTEGAETDATNAQEQGQGEQTAAAGAEAAQTEEARQEPPQGDGGREADERGGEGRQASNVAPIERAPSTYVGPAPTIGRVVHYFLTYADAQAITRKRLNTGTEGNPVIAGQTFPMIVTAIDDQNECLNGQVLLDGADTLWATGVQFGNAPGNCAWPPRVS